MTTKKQAHGHITIIQEERFRLATDAGQVYLFTLAHRASQKAADLQRFRDDNAPVTVEYTGDPGFDSCTALAVTPT